MFQAVTAVLSKSLVLLSILAVYVTRGVPVRTLKGTIILIATVATAVIAVAVLHQQYGSGQLFWIAHYAKNTDDF